MILSGTRPANHDGTEHAGDSAGQPLNRLFERHTLWLSREEAAFSQVKPPV